MTDDPKPSEGAPFTREQSQAVRARQRARANALGIILFAAAALFFVITIVKTGSS